MNKSFDQKEIEVDTLPRPCVPRLGATEQTTLVPRAGSNALPTILRQLEQLRRKLTLQQCGSVGAFTGFDTLQITPSAAEEPAAVTLTARVTQVWPTSHTVELVASVIDHTEVAQPRTLVRGTGRSLPVPLQPAS